MRQQKSDATHRLLGTEADILDLVDHSGLGRLRHKDGRRVHFGEEEKRHFSSRSHHRVEPQMLMDLSLLSHEIDLLYEYRKKGTTASPSRRLFQKLTQISHTRISHRIANDTVSPTAREGAMFAPLTNTAGETAPSRLSDQDHPN